MTSVSPNSGLGSGVVGPDGVRKRARRVTGADNVRSDLDNLNRQYVDQVLWANRRLQEIKDVFNQHGIDVQVRNC